MLDGAYGGRTNRDQRINWVQALKDSGRFITVKEGKRDVLIPVQGYTDEDLFNTNPDNPDNPDGNPDCLGSATQTDGPPLIGGRNLSGFHSPAPIGVGLSRPSAHLSGIGHAEKNVLPFERPASLAAPPPPPTPLEGAELYDEPEDEENVFF